MAEDMKLRGLAPTTQHRYLHAIKALAEHYNRSPEHITEEQVRLRNHCEFFLESMESDEAIGKKLGFISQEMGREINTLGSKAYESDIQRLVVEMKDELEKVKEQVLNVL